MIVGTLVSIPAAMLLNRAPCVQFDSGYITPDPAKAGQVFVVWRVKPGAARCSGEVIPRFIDSEGNAFENAPHRTVYQERTRGFVKPMILPARMAQGPASYEPVVFRWRNVLQQIFWQMPDDPNPIKFTVGG